MNKGKKGKRGKKSRKNKGKKGKKSRNNKGKKNNKKGKKNRKSKGKKNNKNGKKKGNNDRKYVNDPNKESSPENTAKIAAKLAKLGFAKLPTKSTLDELNCMWEELEGFCPIVAQRWRLREISKSCKTSISLN